MKALYLWLCVMFLFLFSERNVAQGLSGDGSSSSPWSGTVPSTRVWMGATIFADDIVVPTGVTLTISPDSDFASYLNMYGSTLTIEEGGTLIINPNASATITTIENDGTLILGSIQNEVGTASLIHNTYTGSGSTEFRLYLSGGTTTGGDYIWHYISVPTNGVSVSNFNTMNLVQYIESYAEETDNFPGWVAYDGYQYSDGHFLVDTFNSLTLGMGYNYYSDDSKVISFTGDINTASVTRNLSYSGSSDYQGYNLLGNPYSSFLDWAGLYNGGATRSIANAIFFTYRGKIAAYVSGIGVNGGDQYIPPLQGFFVKSTASNGRVIFSPDKRTHIPDKIRYKKKHLVEDLASADTISFIRIGLSLPGDSADLVVRFNEKASPSFDNDLDAHSFSRTMGDINLWTTTEGSDYCINALPFPENSIEIPIGLSVKISGTFRLVSNEISKLDDYNIQLKDVKTNEMFDLRKEAIIEFSASPGIIENRFVLVVTKSTTGVKDISVTEKVFNVYATYGRTINIKLLKGEEMIQGSVAVYDIHGKVVLRDEKSEWYGKGDLKQFTIANGGRGVYLVVIDYGADQYVEKVVLQ